MTRVNHFTCKICSGQIPYDFGGPNNSKHASTEICYLCTNEIEQDIQDQVQIDFMNKCGLPETITLLNRKIQKQGNSFKITMPPSLYGVREYWKRKTRVNIIIKRVGGENT